jgi:NAD(P)H-dependent FMN reductase/ketosteroid isomerase-like protein
MDKPTRVAVLVGSLRKESFSRKIAKALIARAPQSMTCEIIEIGALPLYNEDLDEGSPPPAWAEFRAAIRNCNALLFVTPEYNRSISGCLKNAVDVGSKPSGQNVFDGMPAGVVSVTPYNLGAFGANHALRQTFAYLNIPVMQQPEAYISKVGELLGEDGSVKQAETAKFLGDFMSAFEQFANTIRVGGGALGDFDEFVRNQRPKIATDYTNGDGSSLNAIVTRKDPATFYPPKGGETVRGAAAVAARYRSDSENFHPGGTMQLEVLHSDASGTLAYWTGLQHAKARIGKSPDAVPMTLRVTEIYRFEEGGYKLVHRHADAVELRKDS